jgi:hypothetical protein
MGPYDAVENGGALFFFGCFITNLTFFQPHFCDVYSDMKVLLLAVYFFLFFSFFFLLRHSILIDVRLARALVSDCFGPDLVVARGCFFFIFFFFHSCLYSIQ